MLAGCLRLVCVLAAMAMCLAVGVAGVLVVCLGLRVCWLFAWGCVCVGCLLGVACVLI